MASVEHASSMPSAGGAAGEILSLRGGSYALRIAGRTGRPILVYGFRTLAEAQAWLSRMERRHVE
jgi:hypothetical protein